MEDNKHIQKKCLIYRSDESTYVDVTSSIAGAWEDNFGDVSGVGDQGQDGIAQLATFRLVNSYNKNYNPKVFYFEKTYYQEDIVGDGVTTAFTLTKDYVYRGSCTIFSVSSGDFIANVAVTTDYDTGTSTATFNTAIPLGVTVKVQYQYYDNTTQNTTNWFSSAEDPLLSSDRIVKFQVRKGTLTYKQQVITGDGSSRYSITATTGDTIVSKVTVFTGNSTFLDDYTNEISVDEDTDEFVFNRAIAIGESVTVQYSYNDGTWVTRFVGLLGAERQYDEYGVTVTAQDFSKKLQRAKVIFDENGDIVSKVMPEGIRKYASGTEISISSASSTYGFLSSTISVTSQDLTSVLANGDIVIIERLGVRYKGAISSIATTSFTISASVPTNTGYTIRKPLYDVQIENVTSDGAAPTTLTVTGDDFTTKFSDGLIINLKKASSSYYGTLSNVTATSMTFTHIVTGPPPSGSGYTAQLYKVSETEKYTGWLITKDCTLTSNLVIKAGFAFGTYFSIGDEVIIEENKNYVGVVKTVTTGSMTLETEAVPAIFATGNIYKATKSGIPIETLIQNTIDDRLGSGVFTVTLASLGGGNLAVNYTEIYAKWWDNQTCFSFGWFLTGQHGQFFGFRYVSEGTPNQLQVLKIDRTKTTADRTMSFKGDFYKQDISDSDNGYRDGVMLYYYNTANAKVQQVVSPFGTALADFNNLMIVSENSTAGINTETEAQNLADNFYEDVQDTFLQQTRLDMPLDDEAELFELVEYENFYLLPDKEKFATDSIKNDYLNNMTIKSASNRIRGSIKSAQLIEVRPGQEEQIQDKKLTSESKIPAPKGLEVVDDTYIVERLGQIVTITIPLSWERPRGFDPVKYQVEVKKDADNWETTSVAKYSTTQTSIKIPIDDNVDYNIRVVAVDKNNQNGIYSSEIDFNAGYISSESKVFQIRSQEQWEAWIENYLYNEDVGTTVDYNTIDLYKGDYTYTMESWFETDRLGEVKTGLLDKIYVTSGDVSLFEVNEYVRLNSEIRQISSIDTVNDILTVSSAFSGVYGPGVFDYQNTFLGFSADGDITFRGIGEVNLDITLERVWDGAAYGGTQIFVVFQADTVVFDNVNTIIRTDTTASGPSISYAYSVQTPQTDTGITGTIVVNTNVINVVAGDESTLAVDDVITIGSFTEVITSIDTVAHTITLRRKTDTAIGTATTVYSNAEGRIEYTNSDIEVATDTDDSNIVGLSVASLGNKSLKVSNSAFKRFDNYGLGIGGSYYNKKIGKSIEITDSVFSHEPGDTSDSAIQFTSAFDNVLFSNNVVINGHIVFYDHSIDLYNEDYSGVKITNNTWESTYSGLRHRLMIYATSSLSKQDFSIEDNTLIVFNENNYNKDYILCATNAYGVVAKTGVSYASGSDLLSMASTSGLSAGQVIRFLGQFFTIEAVVSGNQIRLYTDMDQTGSSGTIYTINTSNKSLNRSTVAGNRGRGFGSSELINTFIDDSTGTNLTVSNNYSQ